MTLTERVTVTERWKHCATVPAAKRAVHATHTVRLRPGAAGSGQRAAGSPPGLRLQKQHELGSWPSDASSAERA